MRGSFGLFAVAVLLASASASACAISVAGPQTGRCQIVGGEKLPKESGGPDALCDAIERAIAARAPEVPYSVEVRVLSASRVSATLTTGDGRRLPELHQASVDRKLGSSSFERFALALAGELAKATSP